MMRLPEIILWLFVVNLGVVFGAGLYEARIVVPLWAKTQPGSPMSPDSGRKFWGFVSTLPLTILCVANLVAGSKAAEPQRIWWLGAAAIIFAERVFTFAYFIPTILRLQRTASSQAEIKAGMSRWARWNHLRNLLTLGGWIAALKALVLLA